MIPYIERTRTYYGTLGYPAYDWASHDSTPFAPYKGAIKDARLALITTAAPKKPEFGDQGPGAAYNASAKFFQVYTVPKSPVPDVRISHLGYDRKHSTAEDPNSWLPVAALEQAVTEGRLGALADSVIGVPTNRSQRVTLEKDAPDALAACVALGADVALLVPS